MRLLALEAQAAKAELVADPHGVEAEVAQPGTGVPQALVAGRLSEVREQQADSHVGGGLRRVGFGSIVYETEW